MSLFLRLILAICVFLLSPIFATAQYLDETETYSAEPYLETETEDELLGGDEELTDEFLVVIPVPAVSLKPKKIRQVTFYNNTKKARIMLVTGLDSSPSNWSLWTTVPAGGSSTLKLPLEYLGEDISVNSFDSNEIYWKELPDPEPTGWSLSLEEK